MQKLKLLVAALIALLFFVLVFVASDYFKNDGEPEAQAPAGQTQGQAFSAVGNVIKDNPGLRPGVWYLLYEQPGSPAITQELELTGTTTCLKGGRVFNCSELAAGDRVSVEGTSSQGKVSVSRLSVEAAAVPAQRTINLYFYNQIQDRLLNGGQVGCSQEAILPVARTIALTNTPIQDSINLLIKGELTEAEKQRGFSTEFPNENFKLLGANLAGQVLTLEFTEVPGFTGGGACRVGLLAGQIIKTAKQFGTAEPITEVRFKPESLFQP